MGLPELHAYVYGCGPGAGVPCAHNVITEHDKDELPVSLANIELDELVNGACGHRVLLGVGHLELWPAERGEVGGLASCWRDPGVC